MWIPGHIGLPGNEKADNLARKAAAKGEIDIENETTIKEIFSKIESMIEAEWQKQYSDSSTARLYKQIEPTVSKEIKFVNSNRRKEVIITRLRLGKCLLNSYLHKINRHETGLCDTCELPETVEHFLLNCPTSNTFDGTVKTLKAAFSNQNIDIIYERVKELKIKI